MGQRRELTKADLSSRRNGFYCKHCDQCFEGSIHDCSVVDGGKIPAPDDRPTPRPPFQNTGGSAGLDKMPTPSHAFDCSCKVCFEAKVRLRMRELDDRV